MSSNNPPLKASLWLSTLAGTRCCSPLRSSLLSALPTIPRFANHEAHVHHAVQGPLLSCRSCRSCRCRRKRAVLRIESFRVVLTTRLVRAPRSPTPRHRRLTMLRSTRRRTRSRPLVCSRASNQVRPTRSSTTHRLTILRAEAPWVTTITTSVVWTSIETAAPTTA